MLKKFLVVFILLAGLFSVDTALAKSCEEELHLSEAAKAWRLIEDFWAGEFQNLGRKFSPSKLVIFSNSVKTECGVAHENIGPFYCPMDHTTYLPLSFWPIVDRALEKDSAAARLMVLAHEYGHHVMTLLKVQVPVLTLINWAGPANGDQLKVFSESLADALAGYFAAHMSWRNRLTQEDIEDLAHMFEGIGDDRLFDFFKIEDPGLGCANPHGCGYERLESFVVGFKARDFKEVLENRFQKFAADEEVSARLKWKIHRLLFGGGPWWPIVRSGI